MIARVWHGVVPARDLCKWYDALFREQVLTAEELRKMLSPAR
jgi:hypothetical protein